MKAPAKAGSRTTMNKGYWDAMAHCYEDEIMSVFHADAKGLIRKRISRIASPKHAVADIGCGIGHFLAFLSGKFGRVYANDISPELLRRAREDHAWRGNITFLGGDISAAFKKIPKVECAVSVNSLISSSAAVRIAMLKAIAACLKPGGHLILVVPSLESSLFVDMRFFQWRCRNGMQPSRALKTVYPGNPAEDNKARQGILSIDGVMTKHYIKEELEALLADAGMQMTEALKIEYGWDSEFSHPPSWMKGPYPWDWFVTARKRA